jgi:glycosyl transferase family 25
MSNIMVEKRSSSSSYRESIIGARGHVAGPDRSATILVMHKMLVMVINLDRSKDRLERMTTELGRLRLDWERIPAVDGVKVPETERRQVLNEPLFHRNHGSTVLPGELGCYLSHVQAIRRFLSSDAQFAVILEDDASLDNGLPAVLSALQKCPERWDMVKLSAVHAGTPVGVHPLTDCHGLAVMLTRCTGSSAYVINRRAANAYDHGLLPMSLPYDHTFDQGWRFGIQVRRITPALVQHGDGSPSTISSRASDPLRLSRKFHWTRRLSTYLYRLRNEWRRVRYGMREWLRVLNTAAAQR